MNAKVSVIVPIYNKEKVIAKCLDSIVLQTYKNLEIILIDDGSTDGSSLIYEKYSVIDKRIRIIKQKNRGVAEARRIGYLSASGQYISFVDSDDYIDINMIEFMIRDLQKYNADIVICKDISVDYDTNKKTVRKFPTKNILLNKIQALKYLASDEIKSFFCNKIFKYNILNENDFIQRDFEDYAVMHKIFNRTNKIIYIRNELYYYVRYNELQTLSQNKKYSFFMTCLDRCEWYKLNCKLYYKLTVIRAFKSAIECLRDDNNIEHKKSIEHFIKTNKRIILLSFRISIKQKLKILLRMVNLC